VTKITFRKARASDLEQLVEIHLVAYPDARSVSARERTFTHNPYGALDRVVVAERRGTIVAQALLLALKSSFGGRRVDIGGIASLAVAPSLRGQGIGTALMQHLHDVSDRRGEAMTMLYAYRQGFYRRLGYGATASRRRLSLDTRSIPTRWRELGRDGVRAARGSDRAAIRSTYAQAAERASGWIARPARYWDQLFARERVVLLVARGGYVAFALEKEHTYAECILVVEELVACDPETRRALLGALAAFRDQASEIHIEVPEGDPLLYALVDPDGRRYGSEAVEHELGVVVGGPMIRLTDVPRAIEARGYRAGGSFDVVVPDDALAIGVRIEDGRAEVGPAKGGGALRTTRAGLGALLFGGLTLEGAVEMGMAEVDVRIADRAANALRIAPLGPIDAF
jgi:predicted acetyltransferase